MRSEFKGYHPTVIFIYFLSVIGITMSISSAFLLCLSFICAWTYSVFLIGKKAIKTNLIITVFVIVFITFINTFFTHNGDTILFYVNSNPITKEAVFFGLFSGLMFADVLLWFTCFNRLVDGEMIMYLFSRISSLLGLLISMVMRYIPLFKARYEEISAGQMCLVNDKEKGCIKKGRDFFKKISILIGWSLESSIDSADSMAARGYGLKGRTSFNLYKFSVRDGMAMCSLVLTAVSTILITIFLGGEMVFYPEMKFFDENKGAVVGSLFFTVLCLIPLGIDICEEIKWKKSEYKI